jgi:hypothetical protein
MAIEQSELAGLFTQQYNITDGSDEEYPADPTDAPVGTRHSGRWFQLSTTTTTACGSIPHYDS